MKRLSNRENEIMEHFWARGPMFVKDLLELFPEPRPHFNTVSTIVRSLESNGYLSHRAYGNSYQYYPIVTREEYGRSAIGAMIANFFKGSYLNAVSAFVKEEKISPDELAALLREIEGSTTKK